MATGAGSAAGAAWVTAEFPAAEAASVPDHEAAPAW
jgi:hypothetical protein